MSRAVKVAVIGTGFAGASHVEGLRRVPGVEVAALAVSSEERAQAAADRLRVPAATGDYRTLLADASIDAVHNCTPNDLHHEVTAAALEARKHGLAEKPLAVDRTEHLPAATVIWIAGKMALDLRNHPVDRLALIARRQRLTRQRRRAERELREPVAFCLRRCVWLVRDVPGLPGCRSSRCLSA